ncbi:hypothetical protein RJ640_011647 [Escallonia rubra]|uniref:Prokaryotic-type class I peptide chain release factors domain-containing protein n=1 Tax=Escallonia rubra TaxID=112253 RepID=A0AA88QNS8_9ASTE|nr:hypothetical protein RJ640_011647 [Escallonia rubra]
MEGAALSHSLLQRPLYASTTVVLASPKSARIKLPLSPQNPIILCHHHSHPLLSSSHRPVAAPSLPVRCSSTVMSATPEAGVSAETSEWAMQDFYTLRRDVETTSQRVEEIRASAGLKQLKEDLANLEKASADSSFWDDRAKAQQTLMALTDVKDKIQLLSEFKSQVEDAETIVMLTEEMDSTDKGLLEEASSIIRELNKALDQFELTQLLSGPYDKEGAVISITAGAGGTDAQDWADMLLRMYVRWGEKQRYKTKVVEKSIGEEAGIKSATIELEGRYAYGYLSGEKGTHRIVRVSPFNAKGLRQVHEQFKLIQDRYVLVNLGSSSDPFNKLKGAMEPSRSNRLHHRSGSVLTSFSGVEVMPLLPEESMDVEIPEEDLDISFTRAGGKGGQNVNKVETAVRITHIPTGVAVRCTEERSQLANKIKALSRLKAKLLVITMEQRASEIKQIRGDAVKADWGQQIRNYVFHPYKLVKDVRSGYETSDIASVMDGELDPFIKAYLRHKYSISMSSSGAV